MLVQRGEGNCHGCAKAPGELSSGIKFVKDEAGAGAVGHQLGALRLEAPTAGARRHQQHSSRTHELVDHPEDEDADEHEDEGRDNLGKGIHAALAVLLGPARPGLSGALLGGEATCQRRERQALGERQLVQRLGQRVGADGAACRCAQQRILQVQRVEHAVPAQRD